MLLGAPPFRRLFKKCRRGCLGLKAARFSELVDKTFMDNAKIDAILSKYHNDASSLIQVLLEIQRENRWLPGEALEKISEKLQVPLNRIQHIVTFYKAFSLVPKGRHEINICTGTACHVRGATRLLDSVRDVIGIGPGETDLDLRFSLETVNCVGCCALGPVIVVDGEYHGKMAPAQSEAVLKRYE
jgi:NADH-quinone oxidoreductase subunit E